MKKYLIVACAALGTLGMSVITMAENESFGIHAQVGQVLNEAYKKEIFVNFCNVFIIYGVNVCFCKRRK